MHARVAPLVVVLLLASCASGPRGRVASAVDEGDVDAALEAYEEFRRTEGGDADLLARVAALILIEEVASESDERRAAALSQLGLAGTRGEPILTRLAAAPGVGPARLGALSLLARRGQEEAKLALRSLADSEDPAVLAAATLGMDPELDRALLLELAGSEHTDLRRAAVRALAPAVSDEDVREALVTMARVDAEAGVRAAAIRALGHAGPTVLDALRERLGDPHSSVRFAAVAALVHADQAAAIVALLPLFEAPPSPAGIEAARLLAQLDGADESAAARGFLRRALGAEDAALRTQAGVALAGLPVATEAPIDAVVEALENEQVPAVRLSFARALLRRNRPSAQAALEALLDDEGMPGVQAAALLAREGHERAREVLVATLASGRESLVRRIAARSLARDAMRPDAVRSSLRDEDRLVRIYAAGGILAAAAAS